MTLLYICRMFKGGIFKPNDENVVHFYFEKPGFPSGLFRKVGTCMSAVVIWGWLRTIVFRVRKQWDYCCLVLMVKTVVCSLHFTLTGCDTQHFNRITNIQICPFYRGPVNVKFWEVSWPWNGDTGQLKWQWTHMDGLTQRQLQRKVQIH